MAKRLVDDGIAGGRTVTLEIKIPNGRNCLKCPAHSKKFGKHACLLYGAWLNTHTYRKKGDLYGWPSGEAVRKCEACLNGSREFTIGTVKEVSMNG